VFFLILSVVDIKCKYTFFFFYKQKNKKKFQIAAGRDYQHGDAACRVATGGNGRHGGDAAQRETI
jgi:hypothetical protein